MLRIGSILLVVFALAWAGCAARGGSGGSTASQESSTAAPAQAPAKQQAPAQQAAPKTVAPPAGHRLAKVQLEMPPAQVREILGAPTSENTYQTGKAWIPYYYGSDTMRTEWNYKGEGRVVFGTNRYSGKQKVIRVDYDPSEDGY